jgi:hypothetical protein
MGASDKIAGNKSEGVCTSLRNFGFQAGIPLAERFKDDQARPSRRPAMLGWLILFALMVLIGTVAMLTGTPAETSARLASSVFAILFLLGLLSRAARGRVW